jgi:hypothetical protein
MILKHTLLLLALFLPKAALAELSPVTVMDASSSGRTVRINLDSSAGLLKGEPVLFTRDGNKIAAGRVLRMENGSSVITILETFAGKLEKGGEWELLYGQPMDNAANLPDYIADREDATDNPANEKFFTADGKELEASPELDDENYTPEVTLRPKFPDPKLYSPHNITVGFALFRNRALATSSNANNSGRSSYTTYNGYTLRYAYTFRTHYWLREKTQSLVSVEATWGSYTFNHTFPNSRAAQIRVMPIGFNLRYLIEMSKLFRMYPYVGYQNNIVTASAIDSANNINIIRGGRLLGGAGAQLVMSDSIDSRIEAGSDGVTFGLVVKF